MGCCPVCESCCIVVQDFDALANAVCQIKLSARMQMRCLSCGGIWFESPDGFDFLPLELAM